MPYSLKYCNKYIYMYHTVCLITVQVRMHTVYSSAAQQLRFIHIYIICKTTNAIHIHLYHMQNNIVADKLWYTNIIWWGLHGIVITWYSMMTMSHLQETAPNLWLNSNLIIWTFVINGVRQLCILINCYDHLIRGILV